jgi:hypothetical protein
MPRAAAFDHTDLAMWLDASNIAGTGGPQNIAEGTSIPLWTDASGNGNNAFQAPVGDPPGGYPGASGGLLRAEMFGPLPPPPQFEETTDLSPSGRPAVRFDTCNGTPIPGCTEPPPTYTSATGLMTNFHAHPDPTAIPNNDGYPAVPDLTVAVVVKARYINDYHVIWSFDGDAGGHNRSLGVHFNLNNEGPGLLADGGSTIYDPDPLYRWMVIIQSYQYAGTPSDPHPQPIKLYVNSPTPFVSGGPESIQGQFDAPMVIGFLPATSVTNGRNITMLLSEMLVFKRTLSDAEVNSLGFELAQKFGIATSFTAPGGVTGDYNNDGVVDAADYTVWRDNLGSTTFTLPNRDPANSGAISMADYTSWKNNFGQHSGSGAQSAGAVPEPSSGVMLLIAVALWSCVGCRRNVQRSVNAI